MLTDVAGKIALVQPVNGQQQDVLGVGGVHGRGRGRGRQCGTRSQQADAHASGQGDGTTSHGSLLDASPVAARTLGLSAPRGVHGNVR